MLKAVLMVVGIIAVLGAGLMTGRMLGASGKSQPTVAEHIKVGELFPGVSLEIEQGLVASTHELIDNGVRVFLLLDPECTPCQDLMVHWQARVADGLISSSEIVGITELSPSENISFAKDFGLDYRLVVDKQSQFAEEFGVRWTPVEFLVNSKGETKEINGNANSPIGFRSVEKVLAE